MLMIGIRAQNYEEKDVKMSSKRAKKLVVGGGGTALKELAESTKHYTTI